MILKPGKPQINNTLIIVAPPIVVHSRGVHKYAPFSANFFRPSPQSVVNKMTGRMANPFRSKVDIPRCLLPSLRPFACIRKMPDQKLHKEFT